MLCEKVVRNICEWDVWVDNTEKYKKNLNGTLSLILNAKCKKLKYDCTCRGLYYLYALMTTSFMPPIFKDPYNYIETIQIISSHQDPYNSIISTKTLLLWKITYNSWRLGCYIFGENIILPTTIGSMLTEKHEILDNCCGLNGASPQPKFICRSSAPQCGGIWRWGPLGDH